MCIYIYIYIHTYTNISYTYTESLAQRGSQTLLGRRHRSDARRIGLPRKVHPVFEMDYKSL